MVPEAVLLPVHVWPAYSDVAVRLAIPHLARHSTVGQLRHVAPTPTCFSAAAGLLWMSGSGYDPPLVYDPKKNTTRTWPAQPKWQRIKGDNLIVYWDCFGEMLPAAGGEAGAWFATSAGLWRYDPKKDDWQGHLRSDNPRCAQPLLASGPDGKTLYWACDGNVAAYDVRKGTWTELVAPAQRIARGTCTAA